MDIREIRTEDLQVENFTFMNMAAPEASEWEGQPVLFDGIVFGMCVRGDFTFRVNYREYRVSSRELFLCLPRHLFTILACSPDVEMKLLLVSPDFLHSLPISFGFDWLKRIEASPCLTPSSEKLEDLIALYSILIRYDARDASVSQLRNALILSFILIIISSIGPDPTDARGLTMSRQEKLTRRFFDLMLQHYEREHRVSFYADKLCTTAKYLSTVIKNTTRHTSQEWINEVVLVAAKRFLKTTDLSVLQISERLHFATASSFVRFFRQHTGQTPLEYRQR